MPPTTQINIRRDTAANFTSANPTLALGEIAYETDTRNIKVGDGATAWTALPYINPYRGGTAAAPTSNTVIGSGAGVALQAGAEDNVLIGAGSGNNITTGDGNVFIGKDVGNQTTGSNSVAIGWEAMASSGSAAFNSVAVGYRSLWQATGGNNVAVGLNAETASGNFSAVTAVGSGAASLNTSSDITAVGANALDANTTGTANTAVGRDALGANTTGGSNVAIGHSALLSNTTASNNVAVGELASQACTTGAGNVSVGRYALYNTVAGANLNALGLNALFNLGAGGAGNSAGTIGIGTNAGRWRGSGTDTLTVADASIFIGSGSRAAGDSQSNQIVIAGNDGIGNGSNTTTIGNSSTTETYLAGNVTINGDDIFGGTVIGGNRTYNTVRFAGTNPELNLTSTTTNMVAVGVSSVSPYDGYIGSTNNTGLVIRTSGASRMSFAGNAGNVSITNGNVVMATAGTGIDFSATANSSGTMTSELLSDYEEGTWTPTYAATGTFATMTVNVAYATYTKVGRMVTAQVYMNTTNVDTTGASGVLRVSGLPFTSAASHRAASQVDAEVWAGDVPSSGQVAGGATTCTLYYRTAVNGDIIAMNVSDLTTGASNANYLAATIVYFT